MEIILITKFVIEIFTAFCFITTFYSIYIWIVKFKMYNCIIKNKWLGHDNIVTIIIDHLMFSIMVF